MSPHNLNFIIVAISLAVFMLCTQALFVPNSVKLHRRVTFDTQASLANRAAAESQSSGKTARSLITDFASTASNVMGGLSHVFGTDGGAKATFFYQEGGTGACGSVNPDSTPLVALPSDLYANGAHCGKNVMIMNTANGKSVTAKVQDMCPGCPSATSLDLSTGAFNAIGSEDSGVLPIQWGFL